MGDSSNNFSKLPDGEYVINLNLDGVARIMK